MWKYTDKVMDHFLNPHNVGEIPDADAVAQVGNITCGDALKLYLKLDAEGKIYCRCHPDPALPTEADSQADYGEWDLDQSRYEAEITDEGIKLTCRVCGASRMIPADSMLSAHAFLNADSLHLE